MYNNKLQKKYSKIHLHENKFGEKGHVVLFKNNHVGSLYLIFSLV